MDFFTPLLVAFRVYILTWQYVFNLPHDAHLSRKESAFLITWCIVHGLLIGGLIAFTVWAINLYAIAQAANPALAILTLPSPPTAEFSALNIAVAAPGPLGVLLTTPDPQSFALSPRAAGAGLSGNTISTTLGTELFLIVFLVFCILVFPALSIVFARWWHKRQEREAERMRQQLREQRVDRIVEQAKERMRQNGEGNKGEYDV